MVLKSFCRWPLSVARCVRGVVPSGGLAGAFLGFRGVQVVAFLSVLVSAGCDAASKQEPSMAQAGGEPSAQRPEALSQAESVKQLTAKVAFQRYSFEEKRKGPWELPDKPTNTACSRLATGEPAKDKLVTEVQDSRVDTRILLPLQLSERLVSQELQALERFYAPGAVAGARREVRSQRDGELALAALAELAARRYAGVFHVEFYTEPKFFHDPNKLKPEWSPGWLRGWLAIHELGRDEALCQWRVDVRSDVSEASLLKRLRETTYLQLLAQLGVRFREAGQRAHEQLQTGLSWPEFPAKSSAQE